MILALNLYQDIFQTKLLPDASYDNRQKSGSFKSQIYIKSCLVL